MSNNYIKYQTSNVLINHLKCVSINHLYIVSILETYSVIQRPFQSVNFIHIHCQKFTTVLTFQYCKTQQSKRPEITAPLEFYHNITALRCVEVHYLYCETK